MISRAIQAKLKSTDAYDLAAATANLTETDARVLLEQVPLGNPPGTADWTRSASFDVHEDFALITRHSPNVERDSSERKSFVTDVVRVSHSVMDDLRWNPFGLLQTPNVQGFENFQELPQLELEPSSEEHEKQRRASLNVKVDRDRLTKTLAGAIQETSSLWLSTEDVEKELEVALLLIPVSLRRFITFNTRLYFKPEHLPRIAVADPDRVSVADFNWGLVGDWADSGSRSDAMIEAEGLVALLSNEALLTDAQRLFDSVPAGEVDWGLSEGVRSFLDLTSLLSSLGTDDIKGALAKLGEIDERLVDTASAQFSSIDGTRMGTVVAEAPGVELNEGFRRLMSFMIQDSLLERSWYGDFLSYIKDHERRGELEADYRSLFFLSALAVGDREGFLEMFEPSSLSGVAGDPLRDHAIRQGTEELGSLLEAACAASIRPNLDSVEELLKRVVILNDSDPQVARTTIRRLTRIGFETISEEQLLNSLPKLINTWRLIDKVYHDSDSAPELISYARSVLGGSNSGSPTTLMTVAAQDEIRSSAEALGWGAWVLTSASEQGVRSESAVLAVVEIVGNSYPKEFGSSVSSLVALHPSLLALPGWSRVNDLAPQSGQSRLAGQVLIRALSSEVAGERAFSQAVEALLSARISGACFTHDDDELPKIIEAIGGLVDSSDSATERLARLEILSAATLVLCADDAAMARLRDGLAERCGESAALAELQSADRARSLLENLRDLEEFRSRVLETARDPELQDKELGERIQHLLRIGPLERIGTFFSRSEDG
jgi:hypothetical protein